MGQMRFVAPCREPIGEEAIKFVYLAGMEGIPWQSRCSWITAPSPGAESCEFAIERAANESGNLYIPWTVEGHGELVLSTACLMERDKPYNLPVELARGTINRLRNQVAEWQIAGMSIPEVLEASLKATSAALSGALICDSASRAADISEQSLKAALDIAESLADEYCRQSLALRHEQAGAFTTLMGGNLPARPLSEAEKQSLPSAWNAAGVPLRWRDIEPNTGQFQWDLCDQQIQWCQDQGWRILGGPLLSLDKSNLPDWVYLWEEDFEQIQVCIAKFLRAAIDRYRGKVNVWHCSARMNLAGALRVTEEQRLRLVVAAIDEVRRADPETPIVISFDQPWAEYLATTSFELSPLQFADSLVRADLGVAGIGLELNIGYGPNGTLPRDSIEISRQLDRWSLLAQPLVVFLTMPSSGQATDQASVPVRVPRPGQTAPPSLERQKQLFERLAPLLLAKHYVQGLFWNQLRDTAPCEFAHGGLFDAEDRPKPVVDALASIRKQHLI